MTKAGLLKPGPYHLTYAGALMVAASRAVPASEIQVPAVSSKTKHWVEITEFWLHARPRIGRWLMNQGYRLPEGLLLPDVTLVLKRLPGEQFNRCLFVEIDRSGVTKRNLSTLPRKLTRGYNSLIKRPSLWRSDFGEFPEVVFVTGRAPRLKESLLKSAAKGMRLHVCTMEETGGVLGCSISLPSLASPSSLDSSASSSNS